MIQKLLEKIGAGRDLSRTEAESVMEQILSGDSNTEEISALLLALRDKGEAVDEVVGFATVMRRHATPIFAAGHRVLAEALVDTCGTGGDARGTFNISTVVAFVVAGAGGWGVKKRNTSTWG